MDRRKSVGQLERLLGKGADLRMNTVLETPENPVVDERLQAEAASSLLQSFVKREAGAKFHAAEDARRLPPSDPHPPPPPLRQDYVNHSHHHDDLRMGDRPHGNGPPRVSAVPNGLDNHHSPPSQRSVIRHQSLNHSMGVPPHHAPKRPHLPSHLDDIVSRDPTINAEADTTADVVP